MDFFGLSCFEERVKEASSSEVPQKKGPVCTYSDSLEKPCSESLATHQRKCLRLCKPGRHGKHELWVKCTTSAECKTDISVVLTVTSGLDPHMINKLKDGFKSLSGYFSWPC